MEQFIDAQDLELLRKRDEAYLTKLFTDCNPYLLKMLYAQRVYSEQAEELVQATWETFFKNLDKFEGRSQIKVFLGGILLNKVREFRRASKRLVFEEDAEKVFEQSFTPGGWWKSAPIDPSELFHHKEIGKYIEECLEGLSESQREVFVLKEMEDEKTDVVCNILGISISNLGVLLFRAKDKLKQCLQGKLLGTISANET